MQLFQIVKSNSFLTKSWSGGTTTELFISPKGASYPLLNFDVRISTATVEIEHSIYTPLKGVDRTLMVLEGNLELKHHGNHSSVLSAYEIDKFQGDWHTESFGKVTNFNAMTMNGTKCNVEHSRLLIHEEYTLSAETLTLCYLHEGRFECSSNDESEIANKGDLVQFKNFEEKFKLTALETCELIWVRILQ